jgi:amidase
MDAMTEIVEMTALVLAAAIRARSVSCVEVATAFLDQIDRYNGTINAIVSRRSRADVLAEAADKDHLLARGQIMGPLHGLPQAIKDLDNVAGMITSKGSPLYKNFVAPADSIMTERMRAAGAIFVGRSNVPEFGLGSHTKNPVHGPTRNPYDHGRTPGGSSGGAAAALAMRMLPVADGSDYGGSLRNPAGWCNVFGFRPSYGRVPTAERDLWLPSMGVNGPMARNVPDLAMLLSVQSGYDPRMPLSIHQDPAQFTQPLGRDFKGTRIAFLGDFNGYLPYEAGVLETCRTALRSFEALGCVVEEAIPDMPIEAMWQAFLKLRAWQSAGGGRPHYDKPAERALLNAQMIFEVESALKLTALDISAASNVRSEWYRSFARMFERYDFLVLPTAQVWPFPIETRWPEVIGNTAMTTYHEWMKVVLPFTMAGVPALAMPAGFGEAGLPIGIQIAGPNHSEFACLQLADAYDRETGWVERKRPVM